MRTSQTSPIGEVEYCEFSKPDNEIFVCSLTGFGFVWRCTLEDKKNCPDLEYCLNEQKKKGGKCKK